MREHILSIKRNPNNKEEVVSCYRNKKQWQSRENCHVLQDIGSF